MVTRKVTVAVHQEKQITAVWPGFQEKIYGRIAVRDQVLDGNLVIEGGTLVTVDNQVDANTGTIRLKANFDNVDERLWPRVAPLSTACTTALASVSTV